jgi:hypothetical protein
LGVSNTISELQKPPIILIGGFFSSSIKGEFIMTIRNFFIVSAIIIFLSGVVSILSPQMMFDAWGTTSNQAGLIITQLSGALEVGLGLMLWIARNAGASVARRAMVIGGFLTYILFFVIMMFNLSSELSAVVWLNIALYLLLALGFGFFAFIKKD